MKDEIKKVAPERADSFNLYRVTIKMRTGTSTNISELERGAHGPRWEETVIEIFWQKPR